MSLGELERCARCGCKVRYGYGAHTPLECISELKEEMKERELHPRPSTDPTGVELVNRFNAMTEALEAFSEKHNWNRWTISEGGVDRDDPLINAFAIWAPSQLARKPLDREHPWLIAQKALGMVDGKA